MSSLGRGNLDDEAYKEMLTTVLTTMLVCPFLFNLQVEISPFYPRHDLRRKCEHEGIILQVSDGVVREGLSSLGLEYFRFFGLHVIFKRF